jgi:hypothetical protein
MILYRYNRANPFPCPLSSFTGYWILRPRLFSRIVFVEEYIRGAAFQE